MTLLAIWLGLPVAAAVLVLPSAMWAEALVRILALGWMVAAIAALRLRRKQRW